MAHQPVNLLLEALSPASRGLLETRCVEVDLPRMKSLYEPNNAPRYAYFPTSGVASVVTDMRNGGTAEVGLIGREGVIGSLHALGSAKVASRCFVQSEGTALRMPFKELVVAFRNNEEIRDRVLESVQEQAVSLGQLAGCNRLHQNQERLSKWLLMAQDRTQSDVLNFTQDFMSMMLGVRRTTVTMIAGALQSSGLIEYQRGRVKIINREDLESTACECYQVTKQLYTNLYAGSPVRRR